MEESAQYHVIDGRVAVCRRCKRKRLREELPEHLTFKTCFKCRMVERDQKKSNQARRRASIESPVESSPSQAEIAQFAEFLNDIIPQGKQKSASAKSESTFELKEYVPNKKSNRSTTSYKRKKSIVSLPSQNVSGESISSVSHSVSNSVNNSIVDLNNYSNSKPTNQCIDPTLSLLDSTEINEDQWDPQFDLSIDASPILPSSSVSLMVDPKPPSSSATSSFNTQSLQSSQTSLLSSSQPPSLLSSEQQSLIQLSFLAKYHPDDQIPHSPTNDHNLCLHCKSHLDPTRIQLPLCHSCESRDTVIKDWNIFQTIIKMNVHQDLNGVILVLNIPVYVLTTSINTNSSHLSKNSILNILYDKFVVPINHLTNSQFCLPLVTNQLHQFGTISPADTISSTNEDFLTPSGNEDHQNYIKCILKCSYDSSIDAFDNVIDPQALGLSKNNGVQCKFSQLYISYNTKNGNLVLSLSHSAHHN